MKHLFNEKTLNTQKLLNSDFICRLIGFVEKYDQIRGINTLSSIEKWINNEEYSNIRYFLLTTPTEYIVNFSIDEFVSLSTDNFNYYQEFYSKFAALLNEKKSLHEEFLSFYE